MGSEERQELEANIEELEDKASIPTHTTHTQCWPTLSVVCGSIDVLYTCTIPHEMCHCIAF